MAKTRSKSTKKPAQKQPDVSKRPVKKLKVAANPTSEDVAEPSTSNHQIQIPQDVHEEIKADPLIEGEDNVVQEFKEQPRASDMYLDTVSGLGTKQAVRLFDSSNSTQINRAVLDFDFEKLCSVSLSNINIYGCLVCGKYFQGRGRNSYAYAHSIHDDHHVFINLETTKVGNNVYPRRRVFDCIYRFMSCQTATLSQTRRWRIFHMSWHPRLARLQFLPSRLRHIY